MKTNPELQAYAMQGRKWLLELTSNKQELPKALPYLQTSDAADAWMIGAWSGYHHGTCKPLSIAKTRGHKFKVEYNGYEMVVSVKHYSEHREAVIVH